MTTTTTIIVIYIMIIIIIENINTIGIPVLVQCECNTCTIYIEIFFNIVPKCFLGRDPSWRKLVLQTINEMIIIVPLDYVPHMVYRKTCTLTLSTIWYNIKQVMISTSRHMVGDPDDCSSKCKTICSIGLQIYTLIQINPILIR